MIRCPSSSESGEPLWLLIPQQEHAALAWQLARHWSGQSHWPSATARVVLAAIRHHDDGWQAWDSAPGLDADHGRPLSFTEMPLAESLPIWSASIGACESLGPLAPWMVAGHFAALLEASSNRDAPAASAWLAATRTQRAQWLQAWRHGSQPQGQLELAAEALAALQFFDELSLRLCLALVPTSESEQAKSSLLPRLLPDPQDPRIVRVRPWSWLVSRLELGVDAYELAAEPPLSGRQLRIQQCRPRKLHWTLEVAPG